MKKNTIAVINGANINILGDREPQFYGRTTLPEILRRLTKIGEELDYNINPSIFVEFSWIKSTISP